MNMDYSRHSELEPFGPMAMKSLDDVNNVEKATTMQAILMKVEPGKVRHWCVGVEMAEQFGVWEIMTNGITSIKITVWQEA